VARSSKPGSERGGSPTSGSVASRLANPLRGVRVSDESHRVTTFELFFDLVFVFAFTQVTAFMADSHSALGILQAMIILGILWWSWVAYAWLANQTHVDEGIVRLGMGVTMAAMFVVALTIPEAFDDMDGGLRGPIVLAVAYIVARVMHLTLYVLAAGADVKLRRQILRTSLAWVIGSTFIVAGAVIGGQWQLWLWLTGLVADIVLTYVTSQGGDWRLYSAAHWVERHGLVVILALGESVVAIGVGAAELPVSVPVLIGAVLGIGLSICLWWLYFDVIALAAEKILAATKGVVRATLGTDAYTYLHLLIIMGIVISALGVEEVLAHVGDVDPFGLFGAIALFGGTSLYLAGHAAFWRRVGGAWKRWRLLLATLLLALIPAASLLPPLAALVVVVVLCASLVLLETVQHADTRQRVRTAHESS
jgi:low temperature requirement protein LtrA